jgi:hypothetical protein
MEDLPIPPFYIAVVAILFLRWLISKAQKAALRREEMRNQRKRGFQPAPPPRPAPSSAEQASRTSEPPRPVQPSRPEAPARPAQTVPETLQELFEMRRQAIAEAQREASKPPPIPPPIPETAKKEEPKAEPIKVAPLQPVLRDKTRLRRKRSSIVADFADRDQIRKAVILKEVLDKPKGFDL